MGQFKAGDKVVVSCKRGVGIVKHGDILEVKENFKTADDMWYAGDGYVNLTWINAHGDGRFTLVNDPKPFNMHGEYEWFIRFSNEEEFHLVRDFVKSQGFEFAYGDDFHDSGYAYVAVTASRVYRDKVLQILNDSKTLTQGREIKLHFKKVVDHVEWPVDNTPETVELNGRKYNKEDVEKALALLKPIED